MEIRNISSDNFAADSFPGENNVLIRYRILKPINNKIGGRKFPLIIVFHGSGAIGKDNNSQLGLLAKMWASPDIQTKYPAFVVAPQFESRSSNYILDSNRNVLTSKPEACLFTALQLVDSLKHSSLNIDTTRIYVIGFSMGASTVINAISLRPDLFTAAVSISGIPQFRSMESLKNIPIWFMHGNMDTENPISSDRQFYKEASSNKAIRFWEFDSVGHDNIFQAFIPVADIPEWLFSQH